MVEKWSCLIAGVIISTLFSFNIASADILYEQTDFRTNSGKYSSLGGQQEADNFSIASNGIIKTVTWWGWDVNEDTDDFTLRFYSDASGLPDALLKEYNIGLATRTDTGMDTNESSQYTSDVYEYRYTLSTPFHMSAGSTYWMSILNRNYTNWIWSAAEIDGDQHAYRSNAGGPWVLNGTNFSFVLEGNVSVPEPTTMLLLGLGLVGLAGIRRKMK